MKAFLLALSVAAAPAMADIITVPAAGSVDETMTALEAAVTGAGATVFARVDHAGGAQSVGQELAPSQLLIFGNPKLGTPAMQADPLAGLVLPLKVLVYQDAEGSVFLTYESVDGMFEGMAIPDDAPVRGMMAGALKNLTAKAAGQ
ncbi:DUF302 domain-containing protein [Parasulfitobacter algicola]|uniref:DUF302 domain-containing protein n=1 Tax=Parasulfitobacter algicola TaxID=2614809 RepID=A0ABX2IMT1_9RHOB|nr:DUF302 domain-containing protein [Sulfitobacter algicola]NSX54194.1 DUF302 domain-containing protein [Sulfitobacter algicola]